MAENGSNKAYDPKNYTEAELRAIIRAFGDLSDGLQVHHFNEETGCTSPDDEKNYEVARTAFWDKYKS